MREKLTSDDIVDALALLAQAGARNVTSTDVIRATGGSSATVRRMLDRLVAQGRVARSGQARATRYRLLSSFDDDDDGFFAEEAPPPYSAQHTIPWSAQSRAIFRKLNAPLAAREPVGYQREFVDRYQPNRSSLLPAALAETLHREGSLHGQQPAGTYARKVLEQLLIDLSWSSSRLEGNTYSLLATQELFRSGAGAGDMDAIMLLNHKAAIEFMVDAVPVHGLSLSVLRNLHAILMQDLLSETQALGMVRNKLVNITGTTYMPLQAPQLLSEMLDRVVEKARLIKNPVEAAFFLWVNLAYLQPFEDGNKRSSRLAANIPLMLYNCAPLSFIDVGIKDYANAMLGVYEFGKVSAAVDLFEWTYRRGMKKYQLIVQALGVPDPMRLRYREALNQGIAMVVRDRKSLRKTLTALGLTKTHAPGFAELLGDELDKLEVWNCARYRVGMTDAQSWIDDGRPR